MHCRILQASAADSVTDAEAGLMVLGLDAMRGFGKAIGCMQMLC